VIVDISQHRVFFGRIRQAEIPGKLNVLESTIQKLPSRKRQADMIV
jgi:hypothetical protein